MILLAIDTCFSCASVALLTEDKLLGVSYINNGLTHSTKLIPMITELLSHLGLEMGDVDAIACTNGPGSFTGIRIGIATAKGLAMPSEKPIVTVSSLHGLAYNFPCQSLPVCAMTDARNSQVFYGVFRHSENGFETTVPPSADDISKVCESISAPTIVCGDGSVKYAEVLSKNENVIFAPSHLNMPSAASVGAAAFEIIKKEGFPPAESINALYVRKSSAEQEKERKTLK